MANDKSGEQGLFTVAQVAEKTGIAASTIRYYDQQFEEYLALKRGAGRRRLFDEEAIERLEKVRVLLKDKGLSVRQTRQSLAGGETPVDSNDRIIELEQRIDTLENHVRELRSIQARTLALVGKLT